MSLRSVKIDVEIFFLFSLFSFFFFLLLLLLSSLLPSLLLVTTLGWMASFRQAEDKSRYFKNTPYLHRCLRAKQLLRASELMRAAYHEKEVQFNPIKDNQRPTATRDEYLLLL